MAPMRPTRRVCSPVCLVVSITRRSLSARGESRTLTGLPPGDFESPASAIPPLGRSLLFRRNYPLDVPLLSEHALREVQPLLHIGEPSLHVLECIETRLHVLTPPHPLLQLFDRLRQVAPRPPRPAVPIGRTDSPCERLADRDGQSDERDADGPIGDTEHAFLRSAPNLATRLDGRDPRPPAACRHVNGRPCVRCHSPDPPAADMIG